MTEDDIIPSRTDVLSMAREADREWDCDRDMVEWLEWFAALVASRVAAKEREACAKVLDEMAEDMEREREPSTTIAYVRSKAAAIRERSANAAPAVT